MPASVARDPVDDRRRRPVARELLQNERTAAGFACHLRRSGPVSAESAGAGRRSAPGLLVRHRTERDRRPPVRAARSSSAWRNGFASTSSVRKHTTISRAGEPGGRSSSSSRTALSASAQCRSSIEITTGRRSAMPRQQLTQGRKRPAPQNRRIEARLLMPPAALRDGVHPHHDREHCASAATSRGMQPFDFRWRQRRKVAAQAVDHPVERLVGHRLVSRSSGPKAPRRRRRGAPAPRKRRTSALLPMPDGPLTGTVAVPPARVRSGRPRPEGAARGCDRRTGCREPEQPLTSTTVRAGIAVDAREARRRRTAAAPGPGTDRPMTDRAQVVRHIDRLEIAPAPGGSDASALRRSSSNSGPA